MIYTYVQTTSSATVPTTSVTNSSQVQTTSVSSSLAVTVSPYGIAICNGICKSLPI